MTQPEFGSQTNLSLELINLIVVSLGVDHHVTYVNRKACEVLGREASQLVGVDWFETVLPPDVVDETRAVFDRVLAGDLTPVEYHENEILNAAGERRLVAWHNDYLRDAAGRIVGVLGIGEDITERRAREMDLQLGHEQFLAVLDNLQAVVYVADLETYELLFLNRYTRENIPDVMPGMVCWQKLQKEQPGPCDFCTNDRLVDEHGDPTGPYEWEFQNTITGRWYLCKDSAIRWVDGRLVRLEIAYDITEKKRLDQERITLERSLLRSQKMESLGVLTGGIAHDFNNILLTVQGNADLARDLVDADDPVAANLDDIMKATRRATDLCRQMLLFAGRAEPVKESLRLDDLVHEMARMLTVTVPPAASIEVDVDPDTPAIEADATQVRQVIMNLVTNSAEALHEGSGRITIRVKPVEMCDSGIECHHCHRPIADGQYVLLEVEDDGKGMSESTIDRLYEPFFSTKFTGRGMGLAVVQGVVSSHACHMTVDSQPGGGAVFRIYFAASESARASMRNTDAARVRPPLPTSHRGTVLLVDDEVDIRATGRRMLGRLGWEVIEAVDGMEALESLVDNGAPPDVVLLDATMPGMDGVETLRRLRAVDPGLPVIMTSGHPPEVVFAAEPDLKPDAFLPKPYFVAELGAILETVLPDRTTG